MPSSSSAFPPLGPGGHGVPWCAWSALGWGNCDPDLDSHPSSPPQEESAEQSRAEESWGQQGGLSTHPCSRPLPCSWGMEQRPGSGLLRLLCSLPSCWAGHGSSWVGPWLIPLALLSLTQAAVCIEWTGWRGLGAEALLCRALAVVLRMPRLLLGEEPSSVPRAALRRLWCVSRCVWGQ